MSTRTIVKGFRYRLEPTSEQEEGFRRHAGARRWLWNYALERKIAHYKATGKSLSRFEIQKELPRLKRQPETAWLAECDSQALPVVLLDLERAFTNFFQERARFPSGRAGIRAVLPSASPREWSSRTTGSMSPRSAG